MKIYCRVMETWVSENCDLKIGGGDGRGDVPCPMKDTPNCPARRKES